MECLQVELRVGFDLYKPHRWPLHRFGDCFSIDKIVLVCFT
jgi:hypothetical protein